MLFRSDFDGSFYALAETEPMTFISPEQKAAKDKARKAAALKAERERKAAEAADGFGTRLYGS